MGKVGDAGAAALAKALPASKLTELEYVRAPPAVRCRRQRCRTPLTPRPSRTPNCPPLPPPRSLDWNSIGGKCGTSGDSPSGAKRALCDAWRAKHGSMAKFSGYGPPVLRVG